MARWRISGAFLFIALGAGFPANLRAEAQKLKSADALTWRLEAREFSGSLKEGFHFNEAAPNAIAAGPLTVKTKTLSAREVRFDLPVALEGAEARLYVCDDAKTYCEIHHIPLAGTTATASALPATKARDSLDANGFHHGNYSAAVQLAEKGHKLLLLDFAARWCPGCVRLESEIFPLSEFKRLTKTYVKAEIDVDLFENFDLAKKYAITSIPTLIVLSPEQEEISRISDYQSLDVLRAFVADARANSTPLSKLLLSSKTGDNAALKKIGLRLFASERFTEAIPFLERVQPPPPELPQARVQSAVRIHETSNTAATQEDLLKQLRAAIQAEPKSLRSIAWRTQLLEFLDPKSAETKQVLDSGREAVKTELTDASALTAAAAYESVGEFAGFERFLLAISAAEMTEAAHVAGSEVSAAWNRAAEVGKEAGIDARQHGPGLRYLLVLTQAQNFAQAETLVNELIRAYPNDTDLWRRKTKILLGLRKYPEAIAAGERSLRDSEGRGEFFVVESLASAYLANKEPGKAKDLLAHALARPEIQVDKMKGTREKLEKMRAAL